MEEQNICHIDEDLYVEGEISLLYGFIPLIILTVAGGFLLRYASYSGYDNYTWADIAICSMTATGFFALLLYLDAEMTFLSRIAIKRLYFLTSLLWISSLISGCFAIAIVIKASS